MKQTAIIAMMKKMNTMVWIGCAALTMMGPAHGGFCGDKGCSATSDFDSRMTVVLSPERNTQPMLCATCQPSNCQSCQNTCSQCWS